MYRKVYRQEGGLSNLGSEAFMRQEVDKSLAKFKQRSSNVGQQARSRPPRYSNLDSDSDLANQAGRLTARTISNLNPEEWLYRGPTGLRSDARATAKALTFPESRAMDLTYKYNPKLSPNPPTTKVGEVIDRLKYTGKGLQSLTGKDVGPIGGGTPGGRKIYETVMGLPGLEKTLKTVGRVAGPVGTGLSIADAIARYKAGDYGGAVLSTLSAIPGFGIPATVAQLGTDYMGWTGNKATDQVQAEQPLTKEQFEQNLPEGYRPLNVTYDSYWDEYGTKPYDDILKEKIETRKGSYSGMPVILSPKNADFFQQYFQGPITQLHTRPEDRAAKIAEMEDYYKSYPDTFWNQYQEQQQANAFQPVATPLSMQNEQQATGFQKVNDINNAFQKVNNEVLKPVQEQQQGLPSLMKIVDEQRNPTPVDPNAPYGYVEYTPPFIGGGMMPTPRMVPADEQGNPIIPSKNIFKAI